MATGSFPTSRRDPARVRAVSADTSCAGPGTDQVDPESGTANPATELKDVEGEVLDRYERDKLSVIESQIAAADPEFAAILRGNERHPPRTFARTGLRTIVGLLVIVAGGLLALNLPAYSLAMAGLAAVLWWLRGFTVDTQ